MKTEKYIACFEHGKPELFRTIAEMSERFGIGREYATELVKSYDKYLVLADDSKCWLDFLALPGEKKRKAREFIAFSTDGADFVFSSIAEAERTLNVSATKLRNILENGKSAHAITAGICNNMWFYFDELFTGDED